MRYKIQYAIDEYTFPVEAYIHAVRLDEKYIHVELTDQRVLSIPLWWIPTVYNASAEGRTKFDISQSRTMIIWNPDTCRINDEISIADYLGPVSNKAKLISMPHEPKKRIAEAKSYPKRKR